MGGNNVAWFIVLQEMFCYSKHSKCASKEGPRQRPGAFTFHVALKNVYVKSDPGEMNK